MSVGMPSDDVLRELDSRHDEVLAQITELDERVLRVLSTCQEYRGEPRQERMDQMGILGDMADEERVDHSTQIGSFEQERWEDSPGFADAA